ncbi:MAG: hypothetical protein ACE5JG_04150, partial [Planctomycetota bacterium]
LVGEGSAPGKQERGRLRRIVRKLTERPGKEEAERAHQIARSAADGADLLGKARLLQAAGEYRVATRICQELVYGDYPREVKDGARALRREIERAAAADVPGAEQDAATAVLTDDRFDRLDVALSRHFIFLGPQSFVGTIPERERTLLDLAYVFQSDLASQQLTFDGVRILVYYQETFDFGGALAGGKKIRVGRRAIRLPVAGMLHYHELGHCIFGRGWLHRGFTEGLADFAAGFTLDVLGETARGRAFIVGAREQFVRFYLGRDMAYFRIQPYRPAAGFLFSFLPPGDAPYDWSPYRRVFHRLREAQFGSWPEREHQIMRYFGYLLATEYGPEVFERLRTWRFPVGPRDRRAVPEEVDRLLPPLKRAEFLLVKDSVAEAVSLFQDVADRGRHSQLAARARYGLLRAAVRTRDGAEAQRRTAELGIVRDFLLLGAFHARGRTPDIVYPPETGPLDLSRELRVGIEAGVWKRAEVGPAGTVDLRRQGYGYPDGACAFAVTYVRVPRARAVRISVGSDDGHLLLVNGELAGKRTSRGLRFDDHRHEVRLRAGWNRILLKVHNGTGPWGFLLRVTDLEGEPLPRAVFSAEDHEADLPAADAAAWKRRPLVSEEFRQLSAERWRVGVGGFDTRNGRLRPLDDRRAGQWQRFLVTPDKPKNGPSNILWLRHRALASARSFQIELSVAGDGRSLPPRFGITVDGEGERDGQSGHTFVLYPSDGRLACDWYRYDRLLYHQPGAEVEPAGEYRVSLRRRGRKWRLGVNGTPLFDGVDAAPLPAFDVGLLTWGRRPEIDAFRWGRIEPLKR